MIVFSFLLLLLLAPSAVASGDGGAESAAETTQPADEEPEAPETAAPESADATGPATETAAPTGEVNLLGRAKTGAGEGRRNENVQFNLIDNNAAKEAAIRLGTSATLVSDFDPERGYFSSELGAAPEGPVSLGARVLDDWHGNVFWRHLNSVTSARAFFQVGGVQPARENDYGFRVGRPLWRGADFSVDASQRRIRGNVNGNVLVPRPDERTPLATDPAERALIQRMLDVFPAEAPNRPDINERMLNTNAPQGIDDDSFTSRFDQSWGDRSRVSLQYAYLQQRVDAFQLIRTQNPDTTTRSHRARITYARTLTPVAELQLTTAFDRAASLLTQEETTFTRAVFASTALTSFGNGTNIPIDRARNVFRHGVLVRHTVGRHQLTYGGEVFRRQVSGSEVDSHRGAYSFNRAFGNDAVTNLRLGTSSRYFLAVGNVHRGYRNWEGQGFFGDRWSPASGLDLNIGLRWGFLTAPTEVDDIDRVPYDCDCNNFAPTFGFAYRLPAGVGRLRGGFGLHYGTIFDVTYMQIRYNSPNNAKLVIPTPDLLDPARDVGVVDPRTVRSVLYEMDPELAAPYSMQYNLSWEFEPVREWLVSLGYVGSRSPKLLAQWHFNRARMVEGIPTTLATVNERRPDPEILDRRSVLNGSRGYYDAAKIELTVPDWKGFNVRASYWFSKLMDLGTDYANTASNEDSWRARSQQETDIHPDMKALSRFDSPHATLVRVAYATPSGPRGSVRSKLLGNWTVSMVSLMKTGTPFNIEMGSDAPGLGNVDGLPGERPMLLDPTVWGATIGHPDTVLPREAFGFIEPGASGNLGRNVFRKGPIRNVNASLARRWSLGGETALTLRAESVNFLNTPQFAAPGTRLTDQNFGVITNTLNEGRTFRVGIDAAF